MFVTIPVRRQPDLNGAPDWWLRAACRGMFSTQEGQDLFFDYGRNPDKIQRAKNVCASCPVWRECRRDNMGVPAGIFGGLTERERWELLGRGRRQPSDAEARAFFFEQYECTRARS